MPAALGRIAALPPLARATLAIATACAAAITVLALGLRHVEPRRDAAADWPPATPEAAAAQSEALLGMALEQVYRAFGETGETAIYDALARVAADDALEALYLQRRDALVNAAFDGGAQRVDHIDVLAAEATVEGDRVAVDGRWRVIGAVGHQDHQHVRGAAYTARLAFALRPEGWRMVDFALRDIDREAVGEPLGP
jgi:hypothetical protein